MTFNNSTWTPESWKTKPRTHDIDYTNDTRAQTVFNKLYRLPPLVSFHEINQLTSQLIEVAEGKRFLLIGGDCAEMFDYCTSSQIECRLKLLLQMSSIFSESMNLPITILARMAGQYAKPRTTATEEIDGLTYFTFRGDNINGLALSDRNPDPNRLLSAYFHSSATLNYIRSLLHSDFITHCIPSFPSTSLNQTYSSVSSNLNKDFSQPTFLPSSSTSSMKNFSSTSFFIAHEGLTLEYETCFTRSNSMDSHAYNQSAHFLWMGDKTRQLHGGHVEYFRGLANPIGIKISFTLHPKELIQLLDVLNPHCERGKIILITRYGWDLVEHWLPMHLNAVQNSKHPVIWCCDPMHGNTEKLANGMKTRRFEALLKELSLAFHIHKRMNSRLDGVLFELTGEEVTECIGGSSNLKEEDLSKNYQTTCDPRLNYSQSLDIAQRFSQLFQT